MCINFRLATEKDCELLFKWVNDPKVRENSFSERMIEYKEHKRWFSEKISSDTTKIFIANKNGKDIGQIRIDIYGNIGIIDYSIAREFRGKGYGVQMLMEIIPVINEQEISITKLMGKVKYTNIPSQRAFIKAGYVEKYNRGYIEYTKDLIK